MAASDALVPCVAVSGAAGPGRASRGEGREGVPVPIALRIAAPALLAAPLLLLGACHLIDQSDFRPAPPPVPVVAAKPGPPPAAPAPPLVTVTFDRPDLAYADAVRAAVRAALQRKSDADFDVVATAPAPGTLPGNAAALAAAREAAAGVARAVAAEGVVGTHIRISAQAGPGAGPRVVQVFVR